MVAFGKQPPLSLGKYRHYKGKEYEVIALACDSESHAWQVVYRALYDTADLPKVWVRSYDMFVEEIEIDGKKVPRFSKVQEKI